MTKVAQISCGTEYSGIQWMLNDIAERVGIELVYPEMELSKIGEACREIGFEAESPSLNMMMARAVSMLDDPAIKGALLLTCFKCSEGTIVKDTIRRFLHEDGHAGDIILKRGEAEGDRAVLAIGCAEDADSQEDAVDA